jgi:hypothetical protein
LLVAGVQQILQICQRGVFNRLAISVKVELYDQARRVEAAPEVEVEGVCLI